MAASVLIRGFEMPFDSGTVGFRACSVSKPFPDDALERFAAKAAPPLEHVKQEPQIGWVSGRHLLETRIDEETALTGGFLHLYLRQAQRKIPVSLLRAECRMAELAYMAEKEEAVVPRKVRKQIREEVTERLMPNMPPQLGGVPFAYDEPYKRIYVGATSDKQLDTFLAYFQQTLGFEPVPLTPEAVIIEQLDMDPTAVPALNFSPERTDGEGTGSIGQNFLTWLWYFLDQRKGVLPKTQLGEFGMMMDGPLVLVADGPGAHESAIRKGLPLVSAEAKAALRVGKKLSRVKLILARGNDIWSVTVDGENFVFRGMKLPDGEALDPGSVFEERMTNLYVFQTVFFELFKTFVREMMDDSRFAATEEGARAWVKSMPGK